MKISNQTDVLERRFGIAEAVRMNCEAGFEAIDLSMYITSRPIFTGDGAALIREIKSIASAYGVTFNQAHAPFPSYRFGEENAAYNAEMKTAVPRAIEYAAALGADQIIIHPIWVREADAERQLDFNLSLFEEYYSVAEKCGIAVAIENMWGHHRDNIKKIEPNVCSTGAELAYYIDRFRAHFPTAKTTACLDLGHAGLVGETADGMIRALGGDRLGALHIHDNDFFADLHTLPFTSKMNYERIIDALAEIGYSGDVTLESDGFFERIPDGLFPAALAYARATAAYIRDSILALQTAKGAKS